MAEKPVQCKASPWGRALAAAIHPFCPQIKIGTRSAVVC